MKKNATVRKFLAALLCVCLAVGNFGWVGTAKADARGDAVKNLSNTVTTDQVTLLTGNSELGASTIDQTIWNYRNKYLLGVAADFCVFLEETFWVLDSDAEGRVAVGGDIITNTQWALNYTVGAGDYYWHTPLDELLLDANGNPERVGAATVILGGNLYGNLNDTYYELDDTKIDDYTYEYEENGQKKSVNLKGDTDISWRRKFEGEQKVADADTRRDNHGNVVLDGRKETTKKLVINNDTPNLDDYIKTTYASSGENAFPYPTDAKYVEAKDYWSVRRTVDASIPGYSSEGQYVGAWQKIDQYQTYATKLFDFGDSFTYLRQVSTDLATVSDNFKIEVKNEHLLPGGGTALNNGVSTIVFTYLGDENNVNDTKDCVYLTLTKAQFNQFMNATYVQFENIPFLPDGPRKVVEIEERTNPQAGESRDKVYLYDWDTAYIIINVPGSGEFAIANKDYAKGQKYTSINGQYISRQDTGDDDHSKNNHPGVTSILYNFPEATKIVLGNNFQGTIFAPNAHVTDWFTDGNMKNNGDDANYRGHLSGALIAQSFKGATEFGYRPFSGSARLRTGDLKVTKLVEGVGADPSQEFKFTVTLKDGLGENARVIKLSATYGEMEFVEGVATFKLKGGESITATNLPSGVAYAAVEVESGEGYTVEVKQGTGVIVPDANTDTEGINEPTEVVFINTYTGTTEEDGDNNTEDGDTGNEDDNTGDEDDNTGDDNTDDGNNGEDDNTGDTGNEGEVAKVGSLRVSKTVTGEGADKTKAFRFTVTLGQQITQKFGEMSFVNGVATFTLKDGESMQATGLPAGVTYTVVEDNADSYVTTKSGDTGAITADKLSEAIFINAYIAEEAKTEVPKTGDAFPLTMWLSLTMLAMVGLYLARKGKKN